MKGTLFILSLVMGLTGFTNVNADELDPVASAPQGLVVRVDAQGKREIYKVALPNGVVSSDKAAVEVIQKSLTNDAKVESVLPHSELDDVTSNESWHWFRRTVNAISSYYSYTYRHHNYHYSYYPSYSYNYGGYNYNYYYTPTYWGSRSYNCYQPKGYHYSSYYGGWY